MLRLQSADYIFIDINTPALHGFSTLKKLVSTQLNRSAFVIYTEQIENALCKKAMELGIQLSLQKRTEIFQLIQDLKNILLKKADNN
jgi:DNA-binding NarL/FixJ family response regulator